MSKEEIKRRRRRQRAKIRVLKEMSGITEEDLSLELDFEILNSYKRAITSSCLPIPKEKILDKMIIIEELKLKYDVF